MKRLTDWLLFQLERLLLRGAIFRLLIMAVSILLVSVFGGLALMAIGEGDAPLDAMWWAFLRLTDPGYLGDDVGLARRAVSTALTVLGYVLFMGALIAILTQWLHATVAWLQRGETPLVLSGHLVVLGLTERTPVVIEELLRSEERVRRLLYLGRSRRLVVVVLVDDLDEDIRSRLATQLGGSWNDRQVILRSGSPLIEEHLLRADFAHAAAILIPAFEDPEATPAERDAVTLKTVLSIAHHPALDSTREAPRMIAEIADDRLLGLVRGAYDATLVLLPTQSIASRLIAQNLRHRGLSWVLAELLAFRTGNDLFFKQLPGTVGLRFGEVVLGMGGGLCLGLVRPVPSGWQHHLNPSSELRIQADDRLVVIARANATVTFDGVVPPPEPLTPLAPILASWPAVRRLLVLGWSTRTRLVIRELDSYVQERFEIDVLSVVPVAEREAATAALGLEPGRTRLNHLEGDYVDLRDIQAQDLSRYDNLVVMSRDWLEQGEQSDAQTILGALIVRAQVADIPDRPSMIVELTDPANARLFDDHPGEVILSPEVMGRMMAQVAVRPELQAVLDELFTAGGAEMYYRPASQLGFARLTVTFGEIRRAALARGELALGVRTGDVPLDVRGNLDLAPPDDARFDIDEHTLILVLTTYEG